MNNKHYKICRTGQNGCCCQNVLYVLMHKVESLIVQWTNILPTHHSYLCLTKVLFKKKIEHYLFFTMFFHNSKMILLLFSLKLNYNSLFPVSKLNKCNNPDNTAIWKEFFLSMLVVKNKRINYPVCLCSHVSLIKIIKKKLKVG